MIVKKRGPKPNTALTEKQLEILQWLVFGKTNIEISMIMRHSETAIRQQVATIIAKLSVQNRVAAVVSGLKLGLVRFP